MGLLADVRSESHRYRETSSSQISDMWAAHERLLERAPDSHGRYSNALRIVSPPRWLSVPPGPGWHAAVFGGEKKPSGTGEGTSRTVPWQDRLCPCRNSSVISGVARSQIWERRGLSRSTCQLPAASFKGVLSFTNFSLENGNAQRAIEKAEQSF